MATFEVSKLVHEWTIDNFSYYLDETKTPPLESTKFVSPLNNQVKYFIRLHPGGIDEENEQHISLYLCQSDSTTPNEDKCKIYCNMSLKNSSDKIFHSKEIRKSFSNCIKIGWDDYFEQFKFDPLYGHIIDDKLIIVCQVEIYYFGKSSFEKSFNLEKEKFSEIEMVYNTGTVLGKIDFMRDVFLKSWTNETSTLVAEFDHTWTVENFRQQLINREGHVNEQLSFPSIKSPTFSPPSNEQTQFDILIYPRGDSENSKDNTSIYINAKNQVQNIRVKFQVDIVDSDEQNCHPSELIYLFEQNSWGGFGWPNFIEHKELLEETNKYLSGDKLKIHCKISAIQDFKTTSGQTKQYQPPFSNLSQNFRDLWKSKKFADIVIKVGGEEFKAHKAILAARSAVFSAMFEHDLKEKLENCIEIIDTKPKEFNELLKYIYCDEIGDGVKMYTEELFVLADKYHLEQLKKSCEKILCEKVSIETVVDFLLLADTLKSRVLKAVCVDYINRNPAKVKETEAFKLLIKSKNFDILFDIYDDLSMIVQESDKEETQ